MYADGEFLEERSDQHGVAGFFIFRDKALLRKVPQRGEFVRWLRDSGIGFEEQPLYRAKEFGLYSEWNKLPLLRCRPFNSIEIENDRLIKRAIDVQGRALSEREVAWYKKIRGYGRADINDAVPVIYSYEPLTMELVDGRNVYEYTCLPDEQKRYILENIIGCLKKVHELGSAPYDEKSYRLAYLDKTYERLRKVRHLVPFADEPTVTVNGKVCRNIFFHEAELERLVTQYAPDKFVLLHGDCTFSNIMLRNDEDPVLIDPRGYFGNTQFYGDAAYDWVKLY